MEYCCHIWAEVLLDKVQIRIVNIIGPALTANFQALSRCQNVASHSLFYNYYNGRCSSKLSSLVPPVKAPVYYRLLSPVNLITIL